MDERRHDYVKELQKAIHYPLSELKESFEKEFSILVSYSKNKRVLDVGCGTGRPADRLAHYCKQLVGIDNNKDMLHIAREVLEHETKVRLLEMDALAMEFGDNEFDFVYSTYNLIGSINEKELLIEEMKRVAKKEGVVAVFSWKQDNTTTTFLKKYYPHIGITIKSITNEKTVTDKHIFERISSDYVKQLFINQGLKDISVKDVGPVWYVVIGIK